MEKFASGQESYQFYLKVSEKSEFFFLLAEGFDKGPLLLER